MSEYLNNINSILRDSAQSRLDEPPDGDPSVAGALSQNLDKMLERYRILQNERDEYPSVILLKMISRKTPELATTGNMIPDSEIAIKVDAIKSQASKNMDQLTATLFDTGESMGTKEKADWELIAADLGIYCPKLTFTCHSQKTVELLKDSLGCIENLGVSVRENMNDLIEIARSMHIVEAATPTVSRPDHSYYTDNKSGLAWKQVEWQLLLCAWT